MARALGRFAAIDEAMSTGRLSYAKVRALTRVATPANEARLVEIALATTGAQLERICRRFRRAVDEGALSDAPADWDPSGGERGVRVRTTEAGLVRIEVTLDPAEAALVLSAIEKARDELRAVTATTPRFRGNARVPLRPSRCPDAPTGPIAIAERTLAPAEPADRDAAAGGHHFHQVVIHLDQALLGPDGEREAFLDDGTRVSAEAFRRVSCDSALVAVTRGDGGAVLDVGRKTRAVPAAIRRALWSRDRGCRFPMCSNRRFVHAHHVHHWAHGGRTSLDNLVLLCGFHHRLLHEGGYKMSLDAAGTARFFTPAGAEIAPVPRFPRCPGRSCHRRRSGRDPVRLGRRTHRLRRRGRLVVRGVGAASMGGRPAYGASQPARRRGTRPPAMMPTIIAAANANAVRAPNPSDTIAGPGQ